MQFDCHREQAFFAQRRACPEPAEGIWASRATGRVLCDPSIARLARFLIKLHRYLDECPEPSQREEKEANPTPVENFVKTLSTSFFD